MNSTSHSLSTRHPLVPLIVPLLAIALTLGLAACGGGQNQQEAADTTAAMTSADTLESIVDIATSDARFSTLATALDSAGLVQQLQGTGPFTVFAPTNAAFNALPEGTVAELLQPANRDRLTEILTYHVVRGELMAAALQDSASVTTLAGSTLSIDASGDSLRVGGATVIQPNVQASNGVIHVIDAVLMPPSGESM